MKQNKKQNPLGYAIDSVRMVTTPAQKKKLSVLAVLIFFSAIFDVVGLAAVLPLLKAGTDSSSIHSNQYISAVYNYFGFTSDNGFLLFLIIGLLAYFLFKTAFGIFVNWLQARITANVAVHITEKQFEKYYRLDFLDFSKIKSSLLIRNMLYNPTSYVQWIIAPMIMLLSEFIIVVLIVGAIAWYNLFLFAFIVATIGPATFVVYRALKKRGIRIGQGIDQVFPHALASLTESISGYVDIKLAGQEKYYRDRYLVHLKNYQELNQSSYLLTQIPLRTNEMIALVGIILIFLYALFIEGGKTDVVIMVGVFAAAAYRLMPSMNRILNCMMYINKNQVSIDNIYMYDHLVPDPIETDSHTEPIPFKNNIHFDHISFVFPGSKHPVLSDINFEVKKGERVGFVGASGSGKTTLMNLLLRFYHENGGGILIDGKRLTTAHTKTWRNQIGYVKQDIFLLDGSIRENIILGDEHPDEVRLMTCVKQASLDIFVDTLPLGLETPVGERGNNLSGGQRQRIGIARSLYRNVDVLVFDEATSALDTQTENEVTEAIDALSETHKTIFIIAHRITTLKNCDRIYELKNGKISGVHSYRELIEKVI